jgi:hypothetical protein
MYSEKHTTVSVAPPSSHPRDDDDDDAKDDVEPHLNFLNATRVAHAITTT